MTDMHRLVRNVLGDIYFDPQSKVSKAEYKDNFTLIGASYCGDVDVIAGLLKKGVDVNFADDYGRTALYFAASCGQIEVVKMLLEAGADKNIKNNKKRTPLDIARKYKHQEVIALLTSQEIQTTPIKMASHNQIIKETPVFIRR